MDFWFTWYIILQLTQTFRKMFRKKVFCDFVKVKNLCSSFSFRTQVTGIKWPLTQQVSDSQEIDEELFIGGGYPFVPTVVHDDRYDGQEGDEVRGYRRANQHVHRIQVQPGDLPDTVQQAAARRFWAGH